MPAPLPPALNRNNDNARARAIARSAEAALRPGIALAMFCALGLAVIFAG